MHRSLRRLHVHLDEPDFNLVVKQAPVAGRGWQKAYDPTAFFRWHLVIIPRLGSGAMAGFELGSGIFSNSHIPEHDARQLRELNI
jgi:galactose-1-phosphate uridylyltransferase